jgi:hypothetical protein
MYNMYISGGGERTSTYFTVERLIVEVLSMQCVASTCVITYKTKHNTRPPRPLPGAEVRDILYIILLAFYSAVKYDKYC